MARACDSLENRGLLDGSQVENIRRPLFYGIHAFGVGVSLDINLWGEWRSVKDELTQRVELSQGTLQSNQRTFQFNAFASDPALLRWLGRPRSGLQINHVRIVPRECWQLSLPRPKPKSKFYGQYGWRFTFKDPLWHLREDSLAKLSSLSGSRKLVTGPRCFLYLDQLSDVLLFKLIAAEQLLSLEDRHEL